MDDQKKLLTVRLRWGRRVRFNEWHQEWSTYEISNIGTLVVFRPDGTRRVFAPRRWVGIETRMVTA